jgi:hypothetical protein
VRASPAASSASSASFAAARVAAPALAFAALLVAACGGPDEKLPDARVVPLDAAIDAPPPIDGPPGMSCTGGGEASVLVDLGGDAKPTLYQAAWWNHGHGSKSCFEINVVASTQAFIEGGYLTDPHALEIMFLQTAQLGANTVQVHLHTPDLYVAGTANLTTLDATTVTGTVDATMGAITIRGGFTSPQCEAIFDPCI